MPLGVTRKPTASELQFFRSRPDVAGYASPDNKIVLNPFSANVGPAIVRNELARLYMRQFGGPDFQLTPQQQQAFGTYSQNPQDMRDTVAARLYSGDPSAGRPTVKQSAYIELLRQMIARGEKYKVRR